MVKKNFISIIIPYHKKKSFFKETLQSINKQSYKNFEVIIIYDDIDKSELIYVKKILKNYKFKKKLLINIKTIGAGLSRNKGIKNSKGDFIAFCDADDLWNKNKLKDQLEYMKKKKLIFSHSNYFVIDTNSKKIGKLKVPKNIHYDQLIKSCDIGLSTVMVTRSFLKKNLFSSLKTKEDYLLWLKSIKYLKTLKSINKELVYWRYLKNSLSSSNIQKLSDAFRVYRNHLNFSFLFSIYCVFRLSFYALIKKINVYLKF
jgi:teichuronic acid biosynthesis glycosyltransferase TuaG|tara:strand:- start:29 stop:802 length:774 start_codon:yes stop_codon:yes gene_type:complete